MSSPLELDRLSRRAEWAIGAGLVVVYAFVLSVMSREVWFFADIWDFLATREIGSLDDILRPHAGHWQTPAMIVTRFVYGVFEMDFWPWYFLPRVIIYGAMAVMFWWVARRRGADPLVAMAGLALLLFLGVSRFLALATIGNQIAFIAFAGAALLITTWPNTRRNQWALFGLMVLALMSTGEGVAMLGAVVLVVGATPTMRHWRLPLAGAVFVYASWFLWYSNSSGGASLDLSRDALLATPRLGIEVIGRGILKFANLSTDSWPVAAILLAAILLYLGGSHPRLSRNVGDGKVVVTSLRRLDSFDAIFLLAGAAYVVLVVLVRIVNEQAQVDANRYSYTLFLFPVLVPNLPSPSTRIGLIGLVGVAGLLLITNIELLKNVTNFWENRSEASRQVVEAEARLIAEGEPYELTAPADFRAGPLVMGDIARLVDAGWVPKTQPSEGLLTLARSHLRVGVRPGSGMFGARPIPDKQPDGTGCVDGNPDLDVRLTVEGRGGVWLRGKRDTVYSLAWTDEHGLGKREHASQSSKNRLFLAQPDQRAELVIGADSDFSVCGFPATGSHNGSAGSVGS